MVRTRRNRCAQKRHQYGDQILFTMPLKQHPGFDGLPAGNRSAQGIESECKAERNPLQEATTTVNTSGTISDDENARPQLPGQGQVSLKSWVLEPITIDHEFPHLETWMYGRSYKESLRIDSPLVLAL